MKTTRELWLITYHHKHGIDSLFVWFMRPVKGYDEPSDKDIIKACDLTIEAEEYFEKRRISNKELVELPVLPLKK